MLIVLVAVVGVDIVDTATLFVGVASHPTLNAAVNLVAEFSHKPR